MKKILTIVLSLILVLSVTGCGNEEDAVLPENAGVEIYSELLEEFYEVIASGKTMSSELEGAFAIYEGLGHLDVSEMLNEAGYAVKDVNGDGTPELLVGLVSAFEEGKAEGSILYALYTYSGEEPVCVTESYVRDGYRWMGDGKFCYNGSGGAANSGFGVFSLPAVNTELVCEDFWFSDIKEGTGTEIGYYHNTSGSWNAGESVELAVSNDDFWEMEEELLAQVKNFEMTRFAEYDKTR